MPSAVRGFKRSPEGILGALLGTLWVSRSFFLARLAVARARSPAFWHGKIESIEEDFHSLGAGNGKHRSQMIRFVCASFPLPPCGKLVPPCTGRRLPFLSSLPCSSSKKYPYPFETIDSVFPDFFLMFRIFANISHS
jgi:hypothetical protein